MVFLCTDVVIGFLRAFLKAPLFRGRNWFLKQNKSPPFLLKWVFKALLKSPPFLCPKEKKGAKNFFSACGGLLFKSKKRGQKIFGACGGLLFKSKKRGQKFFGACGGLLFKSKKRGQKIFGACGGQVGCSQKETPLFFPALLDNPNFFGPAGQEKKR